LCSGFGSNPIYQPLFEHWDHVWQGPRLIQKIPENFAVCGALDILSDLCEVCLSFLFRIPLVALLNSFEFSDVTMLETLNEMMSESLMNLLWITSVKTKIVEKFGVIISSSFSQERCATHPVHLPTHLIGTNRRRRHGKNNRRWMPSVKFTIALFKFH
jgi:hypothetical protein